MLLITAQDPAHEPAPDLRIAGERISLLGGLEGPRRAIRLARAVEPSAHQVGGASALDEALGGPQRTLAGLEDDAQLWLAGPGLAGAGGNVQQDLTLEQDRPARASQPRSDISPVSRSGGLLAVVPLPQGLDGTLFTQPLGDGPAILAVLCLRGGGGGGGCRTRRSPDGKVLAANTGEEGLDGRGSPIAGARGSSPAMVLASVLFHRAV